MSIKTACGTRDFNASECLVREQMITDLTAIFKRYNATPLETPIFELKDYLMKKYGDDTKLVYELGQSITDNLDETDSKESLCLRYDLTVPLARYLVQHNVVKMRRYQIAKVYRRDKPNISQGRYREFYQADIDLIGEPENMIPEIQLLKIGVEILQKYQIDFRIKFNFRQNLIDILTLSNVPESLQLTTCSSLDKLDKKLWIEIVPELLHKGLTQSMLDSIQSLLETHYLSSSIQDNYYKLLDYAKIFGLLPFLVFDNSLCRGMDYYTGLLFEFVILSRPDLGTVIAGGRYDNLTQMFKSSAIVPAIGLSVGFERLFTYLMSLTSPLLLTQLSEPIYYLAMITKGQTSEQIHALTTYKLQIYSQLLNVKTLKCVLSTDDKCPLSRQIQSALDLNAKCLIFIGNQELNHQQVTIKYLSERRQETLLLTDFLSQYN